MKDKVLLIYPALFKVTGLPLGLASISAVLKENGYQAKVFDTAFYNLEGKEQDKTRADRLMSKRIVNEKDHWQVKTADVREELADLMNGYQPKIVGISLAEDNYEASLTLTRLIKQHFKDVMVVAGGAFPTLSPEILIKEDSIDIVCLGEGEASFLELCDKVSSGKDYYNIDGLLVKYHGRVLQNNPRKLPDINTLPHPDFSVFDEQLFYKPMQGRLYKMVSIETSRGCPYNCAFCLSPKIKEFFRQGQAGNYYRSMDMEKIIKQIYYQIDRHSPEFIYFSSETFLAMTEKEFDMFIEEYRKIRIPFWFQTRFETITDKRIKALKEVGMFWLTLGVEHGSEDFRKKILKRVYSNKAVLDSIAILNKYEVGASINNIMGFPLENRELIFETIKLNKKLFEINNRLEFNIFMFVPYRHSELYELCRQKGLLPDKDYSNTTNVADESVLKFSEEYKQEMKGLIKTFNFYVELPEKYYSQIKIAERSSQEGAEMFKYLSQLLQK